MSEHVITSIGHILITPTLMSVVLLDIFMLTILFFIKRPHFIPGKLQAAIELIYEFITNLARPILQSDLVKLLVPYLTFAFLFIWLGNYLGLLPGMETIGFYRHGYFVPLFKGPTSDLNLTLAMGLIVFVAVHFLTLKNKGFKQWFKHFFMTKPLYLLALFVLVGLLEIILEPVKYLVLGIRLYGNINAGEMLIGALSTIPLVALPFYFLELLVGFLQALIFVGLSLAYFATMMEDHH